MTTDNPDPVNFTVEYTSSNFGTTRMFEARKERTTLVNLPVELRVVGSGERDKGVCVKATDPTKLFCTVRYQ